MTKVIHIKMAPYSWRKDPNYVYIGRPSKWGNPFTVDDFGRAKCIEKYTAWLPKHLKDQIHELKDKVLVCYCAPEACHGDVLARIADS